MKYTISLLLFFLLLFPLQNVSMAQQEPDPCAHIPQKITNLKPPEFDGRLRWKRTYGIEGMDRISKILPLKDEGFIAVGISEPVSRKTPTSSELKIETPELYLNRHDKDGKLIWEKRHKIEGLTRVGGAILVKDIVLVAADVKNDVQIIALNGLGEKLNEKIITLPNQKLSARGMALDSGSAVALAVSSIKKSAEVTKIFKLSLPITPQSKILSTREYLADIPSRLQNFKRLKDGSFIAAGRVQVSKNSGTPRMGGWVLQLSKEGDIINSFIFPRGGQASLKEIEKLPDGSFIATGEVIGGAVSANAAPVKAAWVMRFTPDGTPLWQDFLQGSYEFSGEAIALNDKGNIEILLNAQSIEGQKDQGRDHARVVTYSPHGQMLNVESFIEASNAQAFDLKISGGLRILGGTAQTGFADAPKESLQTRATYNTWLAGLPNLSLPSAPQCAAISAPQLDDDE